MKINKKKSQIRKVKFGKNVTIVEPVNLYECKIGDNCFIGPFVEIQKNVVIRKNTGSRVILLYVENVKIGNDCFIGHGVNFTNDKFVNNKILKKNIYQHS